MECRYGAWNAACAVASILYLMEFAFGSWKVIRWSTSQQARKVYRVGTESDRVGKAGARL